LEVPLPAGGMADLPVTGHLDCSLILVLLAVWGAQLKRILG
jgi:hypothetical protein